MHITMHITMHDVTFCGCYNCIKRVPLSKSIMYNSHDIINSTITVPIPHLLLYPNILLLFIDMQSKYQISSLLTHLLYLLCS